MKKRNSVRCPKCRSNLVCLELRYDNSIVIRCNFCNPNKVEYT